MAFEIDTEKLKSQVAQAAESAKKTALGAMDAGKSEARLLNSQRKLAKAERQLGALVYSLKKSNEENEELVQKYIENIDELKAEIEGLQGELEPIREAAGNAYSNAKEKAASAYESIKEGVKNFSAPAEEVGDGQDAEYVEADVELEDEEPAEEPQAEAPAEKVCPHCGAAVQEDELFCNRCGGQL